MRVLIYSAKDFEQTHLLEANRNNYEVQLTEKALTPDTAHLAEGFEVVSVFTGDDVSAPAIEKLYEGGVRFIAIRAAGYDNTDLVKARELGIRVANVPEYSPYAIAEHALALLLALNRKLILADRQVHQQNFKVSNLVGFDLHGKTIGIIGTGKIGRTLVKILQGFDCRILGYDIHPNIDLVRKYNLEYTTIDQLCGESDIISVHTGLTAETKHLIDRKLIARMKPGVLLLNTGRGGCVNTADVLHFLETGHIGFFGADVYERERGLFFYDRGGEDLHDDTLKKLMAMTNVLITPHQAFATKEALENIADATFDSIACWAENRHAANELFQLPFEKSPVISRRPEIQ